MDTENLDSLIGGTNSGFSNSTLLLIALAVCIVGGLIYNMFLGNTYCCEATELCSTEKKALGEDTGHCDGDKCYI